jgi:VWFA-related protein
MRRTFRSLTLVMLALLFGLADPAPRAQQPLPLPLPPGIQLPGQPRPPVFRATTRLVVQAVTVRDRNGNPVEGLTAEDFIILEDGRPQEVAFAEYQRITSEGLPPLDPAQIAETPRAPDPAGGLAPLVQPQIAAPPGGGITYQDKRLIVLYFDALRLEDMPRAYQGAIDYVDRHMGTSDLVAILLHARGSLRVRHDFTDDRIALRQTLERMLYTDPRDLDDLDTAFGEAGGEFRLFNNDMRLAALQRALNMLAALPEQKVLVYFSSGLPSPRGDNIAQFRATVNEAVRANVTINPVDARGLEALPPVGSAAQPSPGGTAIFTGQAMLGTMMGFQQRQDTLHALASETGGVALLDYNDLSVGIVQAADRVVSYYIVGYYSTNTQADGRARRVNIRLAGNREGDLAYRESYFAERAFSDMTTAERELHLSAAFALGDPITEITLAVEVNYFQLNRAEYFIPVAVKIPGSELAITRRRGAARTQFVFMGEIRDEFGTPITNIREELPIRLDTQTAEELASRPLQYDTGFTVLPGEYAIKLLVRDEETGRIGTYIGSFSVPNLNRETRLPISSVVLSSQRIRLDDAIYSVRERVRGTQEASPLVQDGQKLLPSVTRVFSTARDLYVFLEAYQRDVDVMQPVVAFVSFYRDEEKVFETTPVTITHGWNERSRAVPVAFTVPLAGLTPGLYDLQVSVLEPNGKRVNFWRSAVVLIP